MHILSNKEKQKQTIKRTGVSKSVSKYNYKFFELPSLIVNFI